MGGWVLNVWMEGWISEPVGMSGLVDDILLIFATTQSPLLLYIDIICLLIFFIIKGHNFLYHSLAIPKGLSNDGDIEYLLSSNCHKTSHTHSAVTIMIIFLLQFCFSFYYV